MLTGGASSVSAPAAEQTAERTGRGKLRRAPVANADTAGEAVRKALPKDLPKKQRRRVKGGGAPADMFSHLSGEDRKNAEAVQSALDDNDLKATLAATEKALVSTNAEVRLNAVEALGWFGVEALPELTMCMADADEDVQQAAENQWELAVQEMEEPGSRFKVIAAAFSKLSNEDQLTSLGGLLDCAATEWIDGAEEQAESDERRLAVVQSLVDIIEGEGEGEKNVTAAREVYESVTGFEWTNIDEAGRYLLDPENYDPDAPSEAAAQPEEES